MRIAFRVDGNARIGGGHIMRCLALADELSASGAETAFVSAAVPRALAERITGAGFELRRINTAEDLGRSGDDWHEPPLGLEAQQADAAASAAALGGCLNWIIVDHYLLDHRWHQAARQSCKRILVIDDLANRQLDCDVLVDETFGRLATDYRPLIPAHATIFTGATYALLRPEFARERPEALMRRRSPTNRPQRILVSLGTTDINGITAPVVDSIATAAPGHPIDVVLGQRAPSFDRVTKHAEVTTHVDTRDMAALMRDADIAVGAAGTSAWERCCMGLPSITLVLAGNQRGVAAAIEKVGASVIIGNASQAGPAVAELIDNAERLATMSAAASAVTDGLGASRVAGEMLGAGTEAAAARA